MGMEVGTNLLNKVLKSMPYNAIIFDIDNVLVDTRASYTDCIRKTVDEYLKTVLRFSPSRKPLFTRLDVEQFKSLGGFNDDWDTCYGLLLYALSLKPARHAVRELIKEKNISEFVNSVRDRPLGVKGIETMLTKTVRAIHELPLLPQISKIFQHYYLNEYVWNEKLLIPKIYFRKMKQKGLKIGIVTGRNREEANFALRRFQIDSFIDAMTTTDETPPGRKKPDPFGLLRVAKIFGKNLRYLYVGDLPDDILAAEAAKKQINIKSCGFLIASTSLKEMETNLKSAGADYVCQSVQELIKFVL